MTTGVLTPWQFAVWTARLRDRFAPAARRGLLSGALASIPEMQRRTSAAPPANPRRIGVGGAVNLGHYRRAWKALRIQDGVRVHNTMPYSGVIESGRRPGKLPPVRVLTLWAQRRLSLPPRDARRVAFAAARAIKARGLLPRRVLGDAIPMLTAVLHREIVRELEAELKK